MTSLRAGVARVALPTPREHPMMGYGARTGTATGEHDPLFARALFLAADSQALLLECDLCLVAPAQAETVRGRIARETGLDREAILFGCIHTHSGPDTGFAAWLTGRDTGSTAAGILDAAVAAGVQAFETAQPARLGVGHAEARIGRNRRLEAGPLDPAVLVLRVDRGDGSPLCVAYAHGCHPTALGHDNLLYSADWPWAANACIEASFPGALPLFVLGAHADVDPRTRGLLDVTIQGQSVGVEFDAVEALGREIGGAVVDAAGGITTRAGAPIAVASQRIEVETWPGGGSPEARSERLDAGRREALRALDLPVDSAARTGELYRLEAERLHGLEPEEARPRIAAVRRYLRDRTAERFAGAARPAVEAQYLRLGDAELLGLPLEPTVDVGLDWKRRVSGPASVIGIANGWMRYLPHPKNFDEPGADAHYEILQSTLVPDAGTQLLELGASLRERSGG